MFYLSLAFIFVLPTLVSSQPTTHSSKINQVENGLSNYHYIQGEPTWSIEERMKHYGIPGMSIAVIHNYKIAWTKTYGYVDKEKSAPVRKLL